MALLTVQVTEQWHRLPREGLLGNLQKLSGHGPGQPGLSIHAWVHGLDRITSRHLFQPQPFCDLKCFSFFFFFTYCTSLVHPIIKWDELSTSGLSFLQYLVFFFPLLLDLLGLSRSDSFKDFSMRLIWFIVSTLHFDWTSF